MKAMVLTEITRLPENRAPLKLVELPAPVPGKGEILVKVSVRGVGQPELDEVGGRTPARNLKPRGEARTAAPRNTPRSRRNLLTRSRRSGQMPKPRPFCVPGP